MSIEIIQLLVGIAIVFGVVLALYSLHLLNQMRFKYKLELLNSFFYFQLLILLFGLYGIAGNLLLKELLPKLEVSQVAIETIYLYLPFLGLPFIIAAWYLLIKFSTEMCQKKTSTLIGIFYFTLTTAAFLIFGFYLLNFSTKPLMVIENTRQLVFITFSIIEVVIAFAISAMLILNGMKLKQHSQRSIFFKVSGVLVVSSILKALSLYYSQQHFSAGIYYILLFFASPLLITLLVRTHINQFYQVKSKKPGLADIFKKFGITQREKEIILEICQGKTNQQIADTLFITLQTVKDHTHNIYQKTGAKNRVVLAQLFSGIIA